jgi:photosystem II stability/assembly factor-like uncharacterized protein
MCTQSIVRSSAAFCAFAGLTVAIAWVQYARPHRVRPSVVPNAPAGEAFRPLGATAPPRPSQPNEAAAFRYVQRLDADGTMPDGALMTAKADRDRMLAFGHQGGTTTSLDWEWLGPGNVGGRIRAIVIDPADPDIIYVGTASGGIWKTTNHGRDWTPLDDFMASLAVGCLVMHPTRSNILYAGTGEGFFNDLAGTTNTAAVRGAGIFKSTDSGRTWEQLDSTADHPAFWFVNRLAIPPAPRLNTIILAATHTGLFRSDDGGRTWDPVWGGRFFDIDFDPDDPDGQRAVAGCNDGTVLYTGDGGVTWQRATGIPRVEGTTRVELAYARNFTPAKVYAAVTLPNCDCSDCYGCRGADCHPDLTEHIEVYVSVSAGEHFQPATEGNTCVETYTPYNVALWVDPTDADHLLVGGVGLWESTDGGRTLATRRIPGSHADYHVVVEHPDFDGNEVSAVYFGNDGGINWTPDIYAENPLGESLNDGLGITQFYGAAVNRELGLILAGAQDNFTLRYLGDVDNWGVAFGGDGGFVAADPEDSSYIYASQQWGIVYRSTDGGWTFPDHPNQPVNNSIPDSGDRRHLGHELRCNFITHYVLDPVNPNRMLWAGRQLWRNTTTIRQDQPLWEPIKAELAECAAGPLGGDGVGNHFNGNSPCNISTIAVGPTDSNIIWVGHNNGQVYVTENGTEDPTKIVWERVDENAERWPNRWVSRIHIDPDRHDTVYASTMAWASNNVWRTEDRGASWTPLDGEGFGTLPRAPVSCVTRHPDEPDWLYVGTDVGVLATSNGGRTWSTATYGPAAVAVDELVWFDDDALLAVTHGRGIWRARIPDDNGCAGLYKYDSNCDGQYSFADVGAFLLAASSREEYEDAHPDCGWLCNNDANGDGTVDERDLLLFLERFSTPGGP